MTRTTHSTAKRIYIKRNPTIGASGSATVSVGGRVWTVAPDWKVQLVEDGQLAYILVAGDVHILSARGEIMGVGSALLDLIKSKYFQN